MQKIDFNRIADILSGDGTFIFPMANDVASIIDFRADYKPHLRLIDLLKEYLQQMTVVKQVKAKMMEQIEQNKVECCDSSGQKISIVEFKEYLLTDEAKIVKRINNFGIKRIVYFLKGSKVHDAMYELINDFFVENDIAEDIKREFIDKVNFLKE